MNLSRLKLVTSIFVACYATQSLAAAPENYYSSADQTTADKLKQSLHHIIKGHTKIPYTSSATDTWDVLEIADQDPNNSGNVIDVYKNASYTKAGGGNSFYNREHSWPKSYGFPSDGSNNYPYTDLHHLFIADSSYNSSRSNKPYAACTDSACIVKATELNNNRGGGSEDINLTLGSGATGAWQTWPARRGDVARALMYLAVRYEGGSHSVTGVLEPDLILTDDRNLIEGSKTGGNEAIAYMGLKSTLLAWHKADPVDSFEMRRNDAIFQYQGNRNPFIDHPEFVACVFESVCSGTGPDTGTPTTPTNSTPWINELHYDNDGTDVNEGVEIAGAQGIDLSGWSLVAYNGNGGAAYKTVSLSGVLANQQAGFGTKFFAFAGLQNGAADGIALVNAKSEVVQFLSYEGKLTATDGPAKGLTSTDIGIAQSTSTAVGTSLQLKGTGKAYSDFSWASASATSNQVNAGQTFEGGSTTPTEPEQSVFSNTTSTAIPDNSSVTSLIDVNRSGTANSITIDVDITHTYRGDISLVLVAPDGSQHALKSKNGSDSANDVKAQYNVNVSSLAKGQWQLRVADNYRRDTGTLNKWSITFN
ncbi:endonuclease [Pseudoalteromonas piratica]|uniref:Endonuclease I n=1 Tax=Pseudoalteromonas piratica TaxID=1348114 RepID=A0A0A7EKU3_9GAMM|nr:endonuclease [Pseudoalteromonas piratica]AIY67315.1 endonuclease I [Pseudoalteromonas piratica]